jgi:hypothetical protein
MTKFYTVARRDGDGREYNLNLQDAARRILHDDGQEYDIRPTDGGGFDLWCRQQVANVKWYKTSVYSVQDDAELAEIEIFQKIVDASQDAAKGPDAIDQDNYKKSIQRLIDSLEADDDADEIQFLTDELAKMQDSNQ